MKSETAVDIQLSPQAGGYASGEPGHAAPSRRSRLTHHAVAVFVLVNLVVLYILHFADRGTPSSATASGAVRATYDRSGLASSSPSADKGHVVSLDADGALRVGAGTTAYLDVGTLPTGVSTVHFAPLGVSQGWYSRNLMSIETGVGDAVKTEVVVVAADTTAKTVALGAAASNVIKGGKVKGLATLSDTVAAVLYAETSADGMTVTPYVVPATIDSSGDGSVELHASNKVQIANSSATTFVTHLSATAFATAYYEPYSASGSWKQRVAVGTIASGKITLSDDVVFAEPNDANSSTTFGQPTAVLAAGDRFAVPWFVDGGVSSGAASTSTTGGLCLTVFKYDAKTANVTAAPPVCQTAFRPAYFVDSAKLSDDRIVLAFADRANNYALTVVTVEFSAITGKATFRGAYVFDDATGAYDFGAPAYGFYPKPTIRVLSNHRVAVGFLNPSSAGKPSIKVLAFAADGSMTAASPSLPLSNADFSLASADPKATGAIVVDMIALDKGVVVAYAGNFAGVAQQRLAFVESYGRPIGVLAAVDGSDLQVAVSGEVESATTLSAGRACYAATDGHLYTPSTTTNDQFVLAQDDKIVLSKDSFVGVAVSSDTLVVTPQRN